MTRTTNESPRHHVVIVGGGFGGLYAARSLRRARADVTLIDRRNFHLFSPMLYQAATGAVAPSDVAQPLRAMLRRQANARVVLGEVAGIDVAGRQVHLADGTHIGYDSLILGVGMRPSYFGNERWRDHAPALKTLEDAAEIRRRALVAFEAAERETDPGRRHAWLTMVVVGGGPTGVEMAGALAELARVTLRGEFRSIDPRSAHVILVEAEDEVLPQWPPSLRAAAHRQLEELGVVVRTGTKVVDVDDGHVDLESGAVTERVAARTIVWAAGVRPGALGRDLVKATGAPVDRAGRIAVEPDLTLPNHPEIFAVGDLAAISAPDGRPVPDVAQKSIQSGSHAGRTIAARLRGRPSVPFRYRDLGDVAMVGRFRVVARLPRVRLSGIPAWLLWLGIHIYYLNGVQTRLLVAIRWLWTTVSGARGSRLITAPFASDAASPSIGAPASPTEPLHVQDRSAA